MGGESSNLAGETSATSATTQSPLQGSEYSLLFRTYLVCAAALIANYLLLLFIETLAHYRTSHFDWDEDRYMLGAHGHVKDTTPETRPDAIRRIKAAVSNSISNLVLFSVASSVYLATWNLLRVHTDQVDEGVGLLVVFAVASVLQSVAHLSRAQPWRSLFFLIALSDATAMTGVAVARAYEHL